ncbi:sigma-70 family RNA polymerase sigma factor [Paenibacillus sp. GSMTC-2017]|nr:sigma-70 family RNA polymerase sigma factor [Paenibacillus sp. GSMTC-2017]
MDQYGQDVWNFAYFLTKNRNASDDITQDVFIQVYNHVDSFRGEASIKTWLLTITRNISRNFLQTAFIRKVLLVDIVTSKGTCRSAEELFIEEEAANEIWKKVFMLPTKYREVLVLQAKYQLSISEISDILKLPQGTVKSRLFEARNKMKQSLSKEGLLYESI